MDKAGKDISLKDGVNVIGYFQSALGNGETGRLVVSSLEKHSIPHSLISADFLAPNRAKEENDLVFEKKGKYAINLFCIDIVYLLPFLRKFGVDFIKDRYNILLFFWETNILPDDRRKLFDYFDEVWVTTRYNQECLSSLISIPVTHIPHPLQLNYIQNAPTKSSFGLDDKFTFLFCFDFFSNCQRKNPLAVIRAFQKAFPEKNDVQLVLKSQNGHFNKHVLQPLMEEAKGDSRIIWIDESMDQKRRYDLMNACDCYVSLHRSEGFGLTMAEAMLLEKPVIATGYSGNLDFMNPDNSFLCGYKLVSVGLNNYPYPPKGVWADVNIDEAVFWMDFVFNHPEEAKAKAAQGKKDILRNHSFDAVGGFMGDRLRKIVSVSPTRTTKSRSKGWQFRLLWDILAYYAKGASRRGKKMVRTMFGRFTTKSLHT